ncbi:hypothetical protein B0H14DRAFT_357246 [Mycena olivaceomarginata]|nr:hypothetical protein B0H14DRAFT_357246 [Mycena olivaceomarginata]
MNAFAKNLLLTTPIGPSAARASPNALGGDIGRDVDLVRHLAVHARTHPGDAAGVQHHTSDMAAWISQHWNNNPSPDYASFPFSPRTAAPGSRECFRCGILTSPPHYGTRACEAQNGHRVPQREEYLRKSVRAILYPPGQRSPTRISQIHEIPYDFFGGYNPDKPLFEDNESENGEGPAI